MAIANKRAAKLVRKQRWLKYFMYILITGIVILGMFFNFFNWVSYIIVVVSFLEILKVNFSVSPIPVLQLVISFIVLAIVSTGFIFFGRTYNSSFLLFIYFQVLVFDGFCQITGQIFGRHQLAPKISAAKTVEGLIGGWIFCLIAAVMASVWVDIKFFNVLLFGLLTGFSSFCGDMLASWYKRKTQVKDYSNWLPGQGGFLDRFDSFVMTGAFYYLLYFIIFKQQSGFILK